MLLFGFVFGVNLESVFVCDAITCISSSRRIVNKFFELNGN